MMDHFQPTVVHLASRDVSFAAISGAPLAEILPFKARMGWDINWVSLAGTGFNFDFHVSFTPEEIGSGAVEYNYARRSFPFEEAPGISVFARDASGAVFHTYSTYGRGVETIMGQGSHAEFIAASCSLHGAAPSSLPMEAPPMKSSSAIFLQLVVVLIGIGALAFLLWEPHIEGRNATATIFEIYFKDPFLAYVYVGSIPFFVAVHRAFGLLGHARRNGRFSQETVSALRTIRYCGIALIGFVAGGAVIILVTGDGEDRPAGIFMSLLFALASSAIAGAAAMFERSVRKAGTL